MKVQRVHIEKFKILEDVDVEVNGKHLIIAGENGLGKSSFIQFIRIALGYTDNIPPNALGKGEVVFDRDGNKYLFKIKIKDGKSTVEVTTPDGFKDNRKSTLAGIVGAIDFDIESFVEMSKSEKGRKEQVKIFRSFLPLEVQEELARYEAHIQSNYDERTFVNKQIKELSGSVKTNPLYGVPFNKKPVDVSELVKEMEAITTANSKVNDVLNRYNQREESIKEMDEEIKELQEKLVELQEKRASDLRKQEEAKEWLKNNMAQSTSYIQDHINNAQKINKEVEDYKRLKEQEAKLKQYEEEAGELTAKIDSSRQAVADTIRQMDSPVAGLEFDDEQLVWNGVPVNPDCLSTSEIMELGARMKMAENPELGILFLERTECIGQNRWDEIVEMCNRAGWEIIAEKVERGNQKLTFEIVGD